MMDNKRTADRFLLQMDNLADPDLFRYAFKENQKRLN
jgi:hypothetical protein